MRRLLFGVVATALALSAVGGTIAIPEAATPVEKTAARELAEALRRITGVAYDVRPEPAAPDAAYCVGATVAAQKLAQAAGWTDFACDEIRRGTVDGRTVLTGDAARGVLYSVDAFLEDVAGVRWWTSGESDYPNRSGWTPGKLEPYRYAPPFRFRETFYRATMTDPDFKVRTKGNTSSYTRYIIPPTEERFIPPEKGGNHKLVFFRGRRSAYHSFFEVLPPHVYAKAHPDWYAEVDGKRIGRGQLCVTNPEMLEEYVKNTLALLRQSPDCDSIQVSQNDDNGGICTCAKCRAAFEAEGAWSGPYLAFANKVAEAVEKEFPHVTVDTFAYQFTRKAPKTVRPRHNVVVRLCDIECAFNRPLADPTYEENRAFLADLRAWSKVAAGNLYIWDYQANFTSYMMPHPNLQVFSDNLRLFREAGAVGVFEQGDAMCPAGDFAALKCYVTAHLMWDPSKDWRALTDEFLTGYYGAGAAVHLKRVLESAAASASREGVAPMGCYHARPTPWITADVGLAACAEMEAALRAAEWEGPIYARRVRLAKLTWDHARIVAWEDWKLPGSLASEVNVFRETLDAFGIDAYCETATRQTLLDYLHGRMALRLRGCDWMKAFCVDGREVAVEENGRLDFAKLYPGEVVKGKMGTRFAEATAVVDGGSGGERTLLVYADWFVELSVNGSEPVEFSGYDEIEKARPVFVTLRPGRNEVKVRVRKGTGGSWHMALGILREN